VPRARECQAHLSVGATAPVSPKRINFRAAACTAAGLAHLQHLIGEYDARLACVAPAAAAAAVGDAEVALLAASDLSGSGLVRHGELAGAFDGHD
jgi:hypothetical protein